MATFYRKTPEKTTFPLTWQSVLLYFASVDKSPRFQRPPLKKRVKTTLLLS